MKKINNIKEQKESTELVNTIVSSIKSKLPSIDELIKLAKEKVAKENGEQNNERGKVKFNSA